MEIMWAHASKYVGSIAFENRVKYSYRKEYNTMWHMLQGPIWNTVWAWYLADLETPDGT